MEPFKLHKKGWVMVLSTNTFYATVMQLSGITFLVFAIVNLSNFLFLLFTRKVNFRVNFKVSFLI